MSLASSPLLSLQPIFWQLRFLVEGLTRKNFKASVSELNQLVDLYGNEARTSTATTHTPTWDDADFILPLFDPSSDVWCAAAASTRDRCCAPCALSSSSLCHKLCSCSRAA